MMQTVVKMDEKRREPEMTVAEEKAHQLLTTYLADLEGMIGVKGLSLFAVPAKIGTPLAFVEIPDGRALYGFDITCRTSNGLWYPTDFIVKLPAPRFKTASRPSLYGFKLATYQGCCGVCISSGARTYASFTGKGIHRRSMEFKKELARMFKYGVLQATDVTATKYSSKRGEATAKVWKEGGAKVISEFTNPRTGNTVAVYQIVL